MAKAEIFGEPANIADQLIVQQEATIPQRTQTGSSPGIGDNIADTTREVQAGTLPLLTIGRQETAPAKNHWWSGASAVGKDLITGAYDEVTEHPLQVAGSAALGGLIGAGVRFAGPEMAIAASVAGAAFAGYELYEHAGDWLKDAKVVANSNDYPQAEVNQAHADLKNVGAGSTLVAAGIAGSVLGGYASGAVAAAIDSATTDTTAGVVGASINTVEGSAAALPGQSTLSKIEWDSLAKPLLSEARSYEPNYLTDLPNVPNTGPLPMTQTLVAGDYFSRAPLAQLRPVSADTPLPSSTTPPPAVAAELQAAPAPPAPGAPPVSDAPPAAANPNADGRLQADATPNSSGEARAAHSGEEPFTPFTAGDTTFTQSVDSDWEQRVSIYADVKQGTDVFAFANRWATLMEQRMAGGEPLTRGLANATSAQAHADGLTGYMVYTAGKTLVRDWKNGAELAPFLANPGSGL